MAVEVVGRADQRRRFHELPRVLFSHEPRWAPPLGSYERWLFSRRHPYVRGHDVTVVRWLARRGGQVAGRIAGHHVDGDPTAWFGAFDCVDDRDAVDALVRAVGDWAAERGAARLEGPALYTPADGDAGVLVEGFEHPGGTGRPWHPPWYAAHLAAAGLEVVGPPMPRWRLPAGGAGAMAAGGPIPPHAGKLADPRLVLRGPAGDVAAVPEVSAAARSASLRRPTVTECAVVRCEGDPAVVVPALLGAAAAAGYQQVWSPWSPDADRPPDTVHRLFGQNRRGLPPPWGRKSSHIPLVADRN